MYLLASLLLSSLAAAAGFDYVTVNGCSGVLAAPANRAPSAPALVFTNGHCLDFRALFGGHQRLAPADRSYHNLTAPALLASLNVSVVAPAGRVKLSAARVLFASMSQTDVAILELEESQAFLESTHGVKLTALALEAPPAGSAISVHAGLYGRDMRCDLGEPVSVREGSYRWPDSLRLGRGCEIYPGVSGSPVIDERTGAVFALANTHYSGSDALCSIHNPCEVEEGGAERAGAVDQSYAVSLAPLSGCFGADGQVNFSSAACRFRP